MAGKEQPGEPMPNTDLNITALVETFGRQLVAAVEAASALRIQNALSAAFGIPQKRGPGKSKIEKHREPRKGKPTQATSVKPAAAKKVKKAATPKVLKARKLQGQYLGCLKSLQGADRAKVKQVANEKGVAEAVKLALSLKKA
jgi:hypothetical protein